MATTFRSASHAPSTDRATAEPGLLEEIAGVFRQFIVAAFDPYRPELHYMRGPGPACRARPRPPAARDG